MQANIEGNNEGRVEVVATARCTYELSRIGAPAAGHARAILASKSQRCTSEQADDVPLRSDRDIYVAEDGNSFDDDIASELVHMEKLRSNVSASEAEICTELRESGAVEFHASDGSQWWWLPPQGYFCQLADIALPAIQANGNELSDADASALEQTLAREDGYRKEIVRAFLRQYACHKHGNIWSIDLAAIARAKARFLLMYTKVQYLHEFLQAWRERCTDDCAEYVSTDLLEGLAIVETSRNGQSSVVALFEDQLPLDRKQRFSALFNARDRCVVVLIPSSCVMIHVQVMLRAYSLSRLISKPTYSFLFPCLNLIST